MENNKNLLEEKLNYQIPLIKEFQTQAGIDFKDKIILEIGSDLNLNVAREFIKLGAKKVFCANPRFPLELTSPDEKIELIKSLAEQTNLKNETFDIIFGIALLEHVLHPMDLANEVKRMLKKDGIAYLSGCPLYPSSNGHHIWVRGEIHYKFSDLTNPLNPWEHLSLQTREEIETALKNKNIPEKDIEKIANYMLSDDTSKFSATKIIKEFKKVKNIFFLISTKQETTQKNSFYKKALKTYSDFDLTTSFISIIISKTPLKRKIFFEKLKKLIFLRKKGMI